jgi:DNA-binding CsgD family transcriptional regulator
MAPSERVPSREVRKERVRGKYFRQGTMTGISLNTTTPLGPEQSLLPLVRPDPHSSVMVQRLLEHTLALSGSHSSLLFWVGPNDEWVAPEWLNLDPITTRLDVYLQTVGRKDPLHIGRLRDRKQRVAALRHEQRLDPECVDAEYAAYLSSLNVGDEMDLVFWHDARPFACLALVRTHQQSPFSLEEFDWDGLRDFIQATLRLHWRTRSMAVEDHLVRKLDLKSRELDIVRHILIGKDNSQIAANLGISVGTVKTHVVSILDKMGVDSRLAIACLVHDLQARLN